MHIDIFLFGMMAVTFAMVVAKRMAALINAFAAQSFFLFLVTFSLAIKSGNPELYAVAGLLFLIKVFLIPYFLKRVVKKIKVKEDLGLFVNPAVSIFLAMALTYMAYLFTVRFISIQGKIENIEFFVSLSVALIGMFIMVFRQKALAQIIGLMVMENGLFLSAASVSGGMPFFVEIAIFFDIFLCVIILGTFVFRINRLFTHIDVDKLTELKG